MSEGEQNNQPAPDGKIDPRGFGLKLRFHPELRLEKKLAHTFAAALSDYLSFEKDEFESHKWSFWEPLPGDPESRFLIVITPHTIHLDVRFPRKGQEWVEHRFETVLVKFREHFKPQVLLHSEVAFRGTLQINGDARTFLSEHVMRMDSDRIDPFDRPVHLIGLRFFFPPFKKKQDDENAGAGREWAVNVRAESLMEDPSKLFLEAEAEWFRAEMWSDLTVPESVARLETVKSYVIENVVKVMRHNPGTEPPFSIEGN